MYSEFPIEAHLCQSQSIYFSLWFGVTVRFQRIRIIFYCPVWGELLCVWHTFWLLYPTQTLLVGEGVGVYGFHIVRPFVRPCIRQRRCFFLISWKRSDKYSSISADTLISIRCTYIRQSKGQGPILLELSPFVNFFLNAEKRQKKVCVQTISLTNGWNLTKLAQTHHQDGGKKWLDFGDLDLIFKVTTL